MEFEKREKGSLLDKNLEESLTVSSGDSEAKPLIFSFVPTVGRLPAHVQLADTSKYLVRIPEEPGDKSPESVNRSKSTNVTFNCGSEQETVHGTLTCLSQVCEKNSQGGFKANDLQGMQQGDLFKAEYVFVVDSEGEDEVTSRKVEQGAPGGTGTTVARPTSLAISSSLVSDVRPKVRGPDLKATSHTEVPWEMASQQRHGQLTSSPTTPERLACTPTFSFVSPTNQPAPPVPVGADPAGGPALEEPRARRVDGAAPAPTPRARSPRGSPAAASYLPVRIVTHSLSPSPTALPAPARGASSAGRSRRASGGSPSRPGPSRLSLLTAILKSRPAHQRPSSPASCPALSLSSLASSASPPDWSAAPPGSPPAPARSRPGALSAGEPPPARERSATRPPQPRASTPAAPLPAAPDAGLGPGEGAGGARSRRAPPAPSPCPVPRSAGPPSPEKSSRPSPALAHLIGRSAAAAAQGPGPRPRPPAPSPPPGSSAGPAPPPRREPAPPPPGRSLQPGAAAPRPSCGRDALPAGTGRPKSTNSNCRAPVWAPTPPVSLTRTKDLISPCALPKAAGPENKKPKQYKTKSSYKVFAAIPTNTLLLEQKALDEPAQAEGVSQDGSVDLPLELCFPAQLRRQTEELCAIIDQVLQDSLSVHSSDSPSRSSQQTLLGSETIKTPPTLPRAAGRETKYANLSSASSTASESQLTKPGVIRPVPIKSKILLKKEEEVYEPNPFSKYLDDNSGLFSQQDVTALPSLHPLYQTKLYPPAKSLLRPQTVSHTDCLSPGPFAHLSSSSLLDEQNSHALLSHTTYTKLSHPMVAIPEHETLASKEFTSCKTNVAFHGDISLKYEVLDEQTEDEGNQAMV
ncbi:LOW QUALITY PROTEIN: muscular LMNA-interacting protein [Erethizon dorsatum]